jgi:uncharacterized RDD family membrane protein YckC
MKCPKCGYLGFETTDRCRHCGYDFSLATPAVTATELPLRSQDEPEAPLADFDLDRMIGEPDASPAPTPGAFPLRSVADDGEEGQRQAAAVATPPSLSLFSTETPVENDDKPLITTPRPPRPPLAVRRATPEVARRRTPRTMRRDDDGMSLQLEASAAAEQDTASARAEAEPAAPAAAHVGARLFSALVDAALLGAINGVILYLTLAIAGISFGELRIVPPVPMTAFLLLLNLGYLIAFTAAGGQTLGKMLTHIRVTAEGGGRVDMAGAVLRAIGILLTVALAGIPYLAVFFSQQRKALHDRLAGTRVIKGA